MIPKPLFKHRISLLVLCTAIGLAFLIALVMTFSPGLALAQTPDGDSAPAENNVVQIYLPVVNLNADGAYNRLLQFPVLSSTPESGPPGVLIYVQGSDFDASPCGVNIYWDAIGGQQLAFFSIDQGDFAGNLNIPGEASLGEHTLVAEGLLFSGEFCGDPSGDVATSSFSVTEPLPGITLDRFDATAGVTVTVSGTNFCGDPACSGVSILIGGQEVDRDITVSPSGTFTAPVNVPGGLPFGEAVVAAVQTGASGETLRAFGDLALWPRPDDVETPPPIPGAAGGSVDAAPPAGPGDAESGGIQPASVYLSQISPDELFRAAGLLTLMSAAGLFIWLASRGQLGVRRTGRYKLVSLSLMAAFGLLLAAYPGISKAVPPSWVTDVNPDGDPMQARFGGRGLGISISPATSMDAYVASELGGIFSSVDGGNNWAHVDDIPLTISRDVMYDPQDANIIIATGRYDSRVNSMGGIWRSTDGGTTWAKPATADPTCTTEPNAWGVSIPDDATEHTNIFVGTSCGVAISADSGATWNHIDPCTSADAPFCNNAGRVYDVQAQVVGGNIQVDVCSSEGFFRSPDGGTTWSAPDPASPALTGLNNSPCYIATAPNDPDTVYLAHFSGLTPGPGPQFCISQLVESTTGGTPGSWMDMGVTNSNCRDAWVVTHPALSGNADEFEVYFGDSKTVQRQTCDINNSPRCAAGAGNWSPADSGAHSDPSDIAFDTSAPNGCPQILSTDGGISVSTDCGATWVDGNLGYHALDIRGLAGTVEVGHTDIYFGTQDNGMYMTIDNAATWSRPKGADVYNVYADHLSPARVMYRQCFGCGDGIADAHMLNDGAFTDPPGNIGVTAVATQFGPQSYAFITSDSSTPANWTVWVTTDEGSNWNQMGPTLPGNPGEIKAAGPAGSPTFYLRLNVGGNRRIYSLSGPFNNTATLAPADAGLVWPDYAWGVDPDNPNRLYATDIVLNQMMQSDNGGASWTADATLTNMVTRGSEFVYTSNSYRTLVSAVGFDANSDTIMVGTRTAGLFVSVTDGAAWHNVSGAEGLPLFRDFFFDESDGSIYAATRGRGLWRIDLEYADLTITKSDNPDPVAAGDQLTYSLMVTNDGPDTAYDTIVVDTLPSGVTYVSDTDSCVEAPLGTLTCFLGDLAPSTSTGFDIVVDVAPDLVYNNGGPLTITNTAEASSSTPDDDLSGNNASEDTLVVAVADLEIVSFEAVDPPSEVLVGEPVTITLRKVIDNNGPSAPMDTELTMSGIAPPDSVVTPTLKVFPEYALGLEENRVVTETFMIKCGAASNHVFTFTNQIMPLHPEDSDPDLSNNDASLDLQVECVVPVQLNIKPGSFPNSINPKNKGVIPVAVLTTMAGEYGLPLDFDATLIDPLSVRFGPPELIWDESGGAFEAHERGHIEDSYEMDEMTKDGDMDMVLHFRTQETGIDLDTTEACVKGEWMDDMGNIHKFYGCDSVRIVPGASK